MLLNQLALFKNLSKTLDLYSSVRILLFNFISPYESKTSIITIKNNTKESQSIFFQQDFKKINHLGFIKSLFY